MLCKKLLAGITHIGAAPEADAVLVTQDSRKAGPGAAFVCITGRGFDGHDFAAAALAAGACMVVSQRPLGLQNEVTVTDTRAAYAQMCANYFGNPATGLRLVAVTGTNGKTTVANVLRQVLEQLGHPCGFIGTTGSQVGAAEIPPRFTTPEAWELNALLAEMLAAGCTYVVLEASSQALDQGRLHGLEFELGIFTNLSQDHLDYHSDMEAYYLAKRQLFCRCRAALVNGDDAAGRRLLAEWDGVQWGEAVGSEESLFGKGRMQSFSVQSNAANYTAHNVDLQAGGVRFAFLGEGFLCPVRFAIPGSYSVANALAVGGAAVMLGDDPAQVAEALGRVPGVKGRCEVLHTGAFTVIRDFAHTADALDKLLAALRPFAQGRLVVLFGCAGQRDAGKRPAMSEAVLRWADCIYLTADNPRAEDAQQTMEDALPPLLAAGKPYELQPDRGAAITEALAGLQDSDVLVLCGKGHEDYQVLDGYTLYFDEAAIVHRWLQENQ